MMGHSHAVSGLLGWVVVSPVLVSQGWVPGEPAALAAGGVIAAGAGLLPDADHPSASIARSLGPLTQGIARIVSALSGGHRKWTHTIWFVLLVFAASFAAGKFLGETIVLVITFFMAALALDALHLKPRKHPVLWTVILSGAVTGIVAWMSPAGDYSWIAWPLALGTLAHLLGDLITPGGLPLLPWKGRFSLPILPSTGGFMETRLLTPLMVLAVFVLVLVQFTPLGSVIGDVVASR